MPDQATRREVIAFLAPRLPESHVELFAERTGGLRTVQLTSILASSEGHGLSEAERLGLIRPLLSGTADAEQRAATLATITAGMTPAVFIFLLPTVMSTLFPTLERLIITMPNPFILHVRLWRSWNAGQHGYQRRIAVYT